MNDWARAEIRDNILAHIDAYGFLSLSACWKKFTFVERRELAKLVGQMMTNKEIAMSENGDLINYE